MALSDSAGIGSALPSQVGVTSGYVLQTDGAVASWVEADAAALPAQTGHSGEYLTTDGTNASWGAVSALPDQTGNNGKVLGTNGTDASWVDASALSLAAFSSTPTAEGLTLAAGALNLDPADGTHPGGVSTGAQTFAGVKTFSSAPVIQEIDAPGPAGTTSMKYLANVTAAATEVAHVFDNVTALTVSQEVAVFKANGVAKFHIGGTGSIFPEGNGTVTCGAASHYWSNVYTNALQPNAATLMLYGTVADGASAVSFTFNQFSAFSNAGAKLASFQNGNGTEVFAITKDGNLILNTTASSIKMKSPDGTVYTATIANGGTWSIS